jgi:5'-nucleotidase/UDP-sugar diphosphatase
MNLIPRPKACLLGVGPVAALLAGILLVGPPSCGRAAEDPGRWVTVLHTNDIHGTYRSTPASWIDGNPKIGGFPAESDYVRRERAAAERSLLLDAGDFMTGNPISDLDYEGVPGGGMVAFLNLLGYDALCLGNHDFDHGRAVTKELVGMARMPVLVANLFDESGALFTGKGYQVFPLGGMKVAVIGLVMEDLPGFLRPGAAEGLRVRNPLESVLEILDEVDARSDLIVLLTHLGVDEDRAPQPHAAR